MPEGFSISVDLRDFKRLGARFKELREKNIPFAAREALNGLARATAEEWPKHMNAAFTLRNRYTVRSIRVRNARGRNLSTMYSEVYSISPYLGLQERGGQRTAKGGAKHGMPIPTSSAAGQALRAHRTRAVQARNYLAAIQLAHGFQGSRQARNAQAIRAAQSTGGFAYLDLGKRRGIFKISSKRGKPRMIYDLSHRTVQVRPRPTLARTVKHVRKIAPGIMRAALRRQLELGRASKQGVAFIGPVQRGF